MMADLVIVAIPATDDDVWKVSSEKIPHMTFCFLGPAETNPNLNDIGDYVKERAALLAPFNIRVDHRGVLGSDEADVLFFAEDIPWQVHDFRDSLLGNVNIRSAYNAIPQRQTWKPHLTLGYPDSPANKDDWDPMGTQYVKFDKIGVWFSDFGGFSFPLTDNSPKVSSIEEADVAWSALEHHGVKGMRWGQRRVAKADAKFEKKANSLDTKITLHNAVHDATNKHIDRINAKPEYVKAANDGILLNDNHPTTQKYLKEYMTSYVGELNKVASSMTNKSGTKKYSVTQAYDFLGFTVHTKDVKHAEEESFKVNFVRDSKGVVTDLILDSVMQGSLAIGEILSHHGVKGMRWGRRNNAPSASVAVTQKGKKLKSTGGEGRKASADATKVQELRQVRKKSGVHALSNEELKAYSKRLNLEQNVSTLERNQPGVKNWLARTLKGQGNQSVNQAGQAARTKAAKGAIKKVGVAATA